MEYEKELISQKLMDPEVGKLIATINCSNKHKNVEVSKKSRQDGNELYYQQNHTNEIHERILNFYSKSIVFAPTASEELALGYYNRSALLLHLKSYDKSILDIEKSLAITSSDVLKVKLLCRKVDCLLALGLLESYEKCIQDIDMSLDITKCNILKVKLLYRKADCLKALSLLNESRIVLYQANDYLLEIGPSDWKDENDKKRTYKLKTDTAERVFSNTAPEKHSVKVIQHKFEREATDFSLVIRKKSKRYGKHLVVTQDVNAGEVVYIEKPHVVCSSSSSEKLYLNCSHCLAIAWNGVPCQHCNWSIFCSEACRKKAKRNYHRVECYVHTHMNELNIKLSQTFKMALRAVLMGIRERGGAKLKAEIEAAGERESTFCIMLGIFSHVERDYCENDVSNAAIASSYVAKYIHLLEKNLPDGDTCNGLADNESVLFIGSLLLKFVQICNKYGYSLSTSIEMCKHANENVRCFEKDCKDKLSYFAPYSSFINNSCIPNVKRIFTNDQKIIVYALEYIPENDQIFESYISSFYETPRSIDRKAILSSNFKFECDCEACLKNWPSLLEPTSEEEKTKFPTANWNLYFKNDQFQSEFRELLQLASNVDVECNEETISQLRKAVEKASRDLDHPSKIRCVLLVSMRRVFDKIYGVDRKLFEC